MGQLKFIWSLNLPLLAKVLPMGAQDRAEAARRWHVITSILFNWQRPKLKASTDARIVGAAGNLHGKDVDTEKGKE